MGNSLLDCALSLKLIIWGIIVLVPLQILPRVMLRLESSRNSSHITNINKCYLIVV
jgi:hypothetical protein